MNHSRRDFLAASVAGVAGLCTQAARTEAQDRTRSAPGGEDGYKLWLRYATPGDIAASYSKTISGLLVEGRSATARIIRNELAAAMPAILNRRTPLRTGLFDGTVVVGIPADSAAIRGLGWESELAKMGPEGYVIRPASIAGRRAIAVASNGATGALYGAFHLLRLLQTGSAIDAIDLAERPRVQLRLLNHWDNLDGSVERGYAGRSLWHELPRRISPRYIDYARANASVGINGAVINNVNADVRILTPEYLVKVAALADVWRPYGVRMYLSANFAAPLRIGGLATADPLDGGVVSWWREKAEEIYKLIPDFGGFTVKANSEGQPGPKDYRRTHAEGANVLADALAPHGGHVIWRAFVYDDDVDPDRAKRAYIEFMKLDGQFRPNVLVQVKNGPIDFQPREPFHPLFGAMKDTPVLAEIQATQEYLGQAKHLVYLGTMWEEFLRADTHAKGAGTTVAHAIEGAIHPYRATGMVSVVNPGLDVNWCGHHFSQSNWYASGRLAWNPALGAEQIAEEWIRMTFTNEPTAVATIRRMMMASRETFVNYTMPLGLHHLIGGDHYAPMPENEKDRRPDWTAAYYHRASTGGIGFDRTMKGSRAVAQYFPPVRDSFNDVETCPEEFLLWFHRCGWDHRMKSGETLWNALCRKYHEGARQAAEFQAVWESLRSDIDARRHREVAERLAIQAADAADWRDHILGYFQKFSQRPVAASRRAALLRLL
jgi:alpha-glucuronidase